MSRAIRARAVLLTGLVLAGLVGCVGIPTSGPVGTGDVVVDEPGVAIQLPADPVADADPGEIVRGFLLAGAAGLADDFVVARKFLQPSAAAGWDPRARVVLYPDQSAGPLVAEEQDGGTVTVTVPVAATVDDGGRYTEAAPGALPEELTFTLRRDRTDQWRIVELEDGVVMGASAFAGLFRRVPVYFATQDRTHLVPDVRWFPNEDATTLAVSALLWGPSPWLRDAVTTGAPDGARLLTASVPVTDTGVARVDLEEVPSLPGQADRNLLQAQLRATLDRVPINDVEVTVAGLPWAESSVPVLQRDPAPGDGPFVLADDALAVLDQDGIQPVDDLPSLEGLDARSPAIGPQDPTLRVVLAGPSTLVLLPVGAAEPVELVSGTDLVAPSIDRFGWVWTGEKVSAGSLTVVSEQGDVLEVDAGWLQGRTIRSLRVARDGARVAIVSVGPSPADVAIDVAAVVRDEDGAPRLIGAEPISVGGAMTDATELAWVDEVTLAVLGLSGDVDLPAVHLVPVGGPTRALTLIQETAGLAAGRTERALYVVDEEGGLLVRQGTQWRLVAEGVRDPVFPG